jgi:peptidoglycan/xylan/chitin deacetylase (PgdA/CDA1 family)
LKKVVVLLLFLSFIVCTPGVFSMDNQNQTEGVAISGLPVPPGGGIPQPAGKPGNLVVLNWAGFKGAVSYTYDDAQPSHIAHYDELQATGVHMTFYVSSNVNWIPDSDALWTRAVKDGHEIGNHTVSHPYANMTGSCFGKPLDSPEAEIEDCSKYIIQHFGQTDVWTMAAPFGDTGWNGLAKPRFFLNRGVGVGTVGPNDNSDPFNLPCYMANAGETAEKFNSRIDSARLNVRWLILLFHTINPTGDNWYAPVEISEITGSINHAKSLGDVWIDTLANVGAYWAGQKLFISIKPVMSGQDKIWNWTLPPHFPKGKYLRVKVDGGTLRQGDKVLQWDPHGYYEVALDVGSLTLTL